MATGIPAEGTLFKRGDGATSESFVEVGRVYDLSGVGKSTPPIDTTAFSDAVRQYINGMPSMDAMTVGVRYDPADTGQDGLISDQTARTVRNFQIVWNSSPTETMDFAAIVVSFSRSASLDGAVMAQVGLQPTTDFTLS